MNRKNRAFAFIAAVAVALSLTTGVMAGTEPPQPDNDVDVTAQLNAGACSATIAVTSGGLGTWTFNGGAYALTSGAGSNTANFSVVVASGSPAGCTIGINFDGISDAVTPTPNTIGVGQFTQGFSGITGNRASGSYAGTLTLNSILATTPLGTYTGDVTVTFSNAT